LVKFILNGEQVGVITFPITEAGTNSNASFMIENNSENEIELLFWSDDGEVTAESHPRYLHPHETKPAKLTFSPSKDRPDSLHTKWGFREIIN